MSASTMMVAIATVTGLRDQNSLVAIFFLTVATMCCGFFTEMISRPAKFADGKTDYGRWQGDPERPSEQGSESKEQMRARLWARIRNYAWRMLPHTLGFLPYCAAWAIIINNFLEQLDDLCDEIRDRMPDFVPYIVYGCCAIFSLFTFVQWRRVLPDPPPPLPPSRQDRAGSRTGDPSPRYTLATGTNGPPPSTTGAQRCTTASCRCAHRHLRLP